MPTSFKHLITETDELVPLFALGRVVHPVMVEMFGLAGGYRGFWFDQELAVKSNLAGIVNRHVEKAGHLFLLAMHVGVEQGFITFPTAPENIIGSAELFGCGNGVLHLSRRIGKNMGIGIRGGTVGIARMPEKIGRSPKKLDSCFFLQSLGYCDHGL